MGIALRLRRWLTPQRPSPKSKTFVIGNSGASRLLCRAREDAFPPPERLGRNAKRGALFQQPAAPGKRKQGSRIRKLREFSRKGLRIIRKPRVPGKLPREWPEPLQVIRVN